MQQTGVNRGEFYEVLFQIFLSAYNTYKNKYIFHHTNSKHCNNYHDIIVHKG